MSRLVSLFRKLLVLSDGINRRRLAIVFTLARHGEFRKFLLMLKLHTAYRLRLRQRQDADATEPDALPPPEPPKAPVQHYEEGAWPKDRPLVSVVIPCFNYGAYVAEAIDSVLAQTFPDIEVIVVEGGSTDATTRAAVEALDRPAIRKLFRNSPSRVGDNRNYGIRHARGKYICCLDADDILRPTYLEKAVFLLECLGYDIVSTSVQRFGAIEGGYGVAPSADLASMLEGNHLATCAVFRRSLWEHAGGFQDTAPGAPFVHEDWRFWVRLAALGGRIRNLSGERLFCYRSHVAPSLSTQPDVLPMPVQSILVRELNRDVVTPEAISRSRENAKARRHARDGVDNLVARSQPMQERLTVLLAMPHLILGGAERLLSEVVRAFGSAEIRVIVVTTLTVWPELGDTTSWFESATSEIYHLPRFLAEAEWSDFVEYVIAAKRVDILLLAGSVFFYDHLPELKARHPRLKVADLLFNTIGHTESNRLMAPFIDLNIVEGEEVRCWLAARGEIAARICLIPSGVDLQHYQPMPKPARIMQGSGLPESAFLVGFSGRLAEEKAPLAFLAIAAQLVGDNIHCVMTGAGPLEEKVRAAAARGEGGANFHFLGLVDDVRDYLACYDVLVLPSVIDGRPTVVMEALAMGIPVVASRLGSLPDLVVDGETGFLCDPTDLAGFVARLQQLADDPALRARMSRAARQFAEQHFRRELMVSRYLAALRDLAQGTEDPLPRAKAAGNRVAGNRTTELHFARSIEGVAAGGEEHDR